MMLCFDVGICLLGPNSFTENDTLAKYEIMDGAPVRGNCRLIAAGNSLCDSCYLTGSYGGICWCWLEQLSKRRWWVQLSGVSTAVMGALVSAG